MSTELLIQVPDADAVALHFDKLRLALDNGDLLEAIGAMIVSQTQRRISGEKTAPDGAVWPDWSPAYEATRHENQSLLVNEGHLLTSITYAVHSYQLELEVGSNLIYAATHQYGDSQRHIPQREYLGLSEENLHDLDRLVVEFMGATV